MKIADNFYIVNETIHPSDNVTMKLATDLIDGEYLDAAVILKGNFTVCGVKRKEFAAKLGNLIDDYRI